ncbi:MAG TPA: dockerin type I domain-containing protein [Phycisphaerae bacterium]|nr:dockerin type I domain-containing protein [Phycisphaerae bacterium]
MVRMHTLLTLGALATLATSAAADAPHYRATILWDSTTDETIAQSVNRAGSSAGYLIDWGGGAGTHVGAFAALPDGTVTPIDVPTTFDSTADALNDRGAVAGTFSLGAHYNSPRRLYRYTPQTGCVDLGVLGGALGSVADMNNHGDILGSWLDSTGTNRVFLYTDAEGWRAIGTVTNDQVQPTDMNDRGDIVGNYWRYDDGYRAWHWRDGVQTDMGDLGGNETRVYYVNAQGVAVGGAQMPDGSWCAFRWTIESGMTALPLLPGATTSRANWITDTGLIGGIQQIGTSAFSGYRAFIYSDATGLVDLGVELGTDWDSPVAMNDAGAAVFKTFEASAYEVTPFVYSPEFGTHDLNAVIDGDFPYVLQDVSGVNACGEITAIALQVNGASVDPQSVSVLLSPILTGDLDGDSDVDLADYARLQANITTTTGATPEQGDLDGDGDVDAADAQSLIAALHAPCR